MKGKKQEAPADGFTHRFHEPTGKWRVYENGKFRQPFDTEVDATNFIDQERAKKPKKGKKHA